MSAARPLVLLVEDDQDTALLYQAMLAGENLEVVRCSTCQDAKDWWAQTEQAPDLVILDMRLPDGNGLDLCQEFFHANAGQGQPPVMLLSAHGDPRLPTLCRQAGARVFLDKLSGLSQFLATALALLQDSQKKDSLG